MKQTSPTPTSAKEKTTFFSASPVMRKVKEIGYHAEAGDNTASYGGILIKTGFFLLMTVVGIIAYLFAQVHWFSHQPMIEGLQVHGFEFSISIPQAMALLAISIVCVITQLLSGFFPELLPVTGTLYSMSQGALISCLIFTVLGGQHLEYLGLLALVITVIVVASMAAMYAKGIIKVDKKFRMILLTIIFSSMGLSLVILICSFIPGVNVFVAAILNNLVVSVFLSIVSIIISTMFLISEFAVMDDVVTNHYPAKFEWNVAFGLAFAILWIYVKILEIIMRIAGSRRGR